ncbi:aspartate--tRNA ligase [Blattabacterium cuenoti]|uniref:aspartate--tRNA ligase n=1 Tax=Blattabacterium cuenoti TaxID=1653831 RepID=UPI00163C8E8E|nr:aspartate--tRNA ligase [Blattabacterium cuenoti]
MYRTHNCGELRKKDIGKKVILSGWIQNIRNFGSLFFVDMRDYFGITQIILSKNLLKINNIIISLGKEFVIKIHGEVVERHSKNYNLNTGEIEIKVSKIEILNISIPLPFSIVNKTDGSEEDRMIYRYLDIRRSPIKNNLIIRHNISLMIRNFLSMKGFIEIETPVLIRHTSEGARNFVVPSRNHINKFYALPQSPQLFKQLLMIGGIDKYFQIVKCFRDEDARSDRQVEFTQVDCEMSFIDEKDILIFFETFIKFLFKKVKNIDLEPFPIISYFDSIKMYGTDSPDLRFGMKFFELNDLIQKKKIPFLIKQELIVGIKTKKCECCNTYNKINSILKNNINNERFFWIKHLSNKTFIFSNKSFLNEKVCFFITKHFKSDPGDLLFIVYGKKKESRSILHKIRSEIANHLNLKNNKEFKPLWIKDIPLFEWENNRYKSIHHPFTSPKEEDLHLLERNPENVRSKSYDLVINGIEIGSGSIRINKKNIQDIVFKHLGLSKEEIESNFSFFIKALTYGAPPHGGIAFGLDRLINLIEGGDDIKNFIAFPKNNYGKDVMVNSPSFLDNDKLNELHLRY